MTDARPLRSLPQVDQMLRDVSSLADVGPYVARWLVRRALDDARKRALAGQAPGDVRAAVDAAVRRLQDKRLRRVINATGVVLHTNLGRAPLSAAALAAASGSAGYTTLEFDLETGERGARAPVAAILIAALCDAQDALVVNNNAGALLLALAALARDGEVIVSRGELIEIGGEFRLPDVMEASGAALREVGTTNRTHARDYKQALGDRTSLILKVHPSNYEVVGFTTQPPLSDLVEIAREANVPLMYDLGSGLLRPEEGPLADEPDALSALAAGCDLVCFSGDKLLGGPQAGIIAGRAELVERCRRHPIARAVRPDKLTLAAIETTLWAHARGDLVTQPVWRMLNTSLAKIAERSRAITSSVPSAEVIEGVSVTGGGSMPGRTVDTTLIVINVEHPVKLLAALRRYDPPVIARIERGAVVLDLRTVDPADDQLVQDALRQAL